MLQKTIFYLTSLLPLINPSTQFTNISITSSEVPRYYLLTLPPTHDPQTPTPVILSFHGGVRTAKKQLKLSQLSDPYFNDFAIVVYPQGLKKIWQGIPHSKANDLRFTLDILADLESRYAIDTRRIWATGKSDGGGFCGTLACDPVLSTKIAAFAPVSGAFYVKNDTKCVPETINIPCNKRRAKVPVLEFHGGNDKTIHYEGEGRKEQCLPGIEHWVEEWAARNDLGNGKVETQLTNDTVLYEFGEGEEKGLVSHVFDEVIGHDWPSTVENADNKRKNHKPASFNASTLIVEFFKKHALDD